MYTENKVNYVYLDEFDSINSGIIAPLKAEQVLFDEIVNKGNCVVFTFNQIVDSIAFMEMWRNKDKADVLQFLLIKGKIKINQYKCNDKNVRTVSQYIQNAIDTIKSGKAFIFSAWKYYGITPSDLAIVSDAIRYNDINLLEESLKQSNNKQLLINYFKMITMLSDSNDSNTYLSPLVSVKYFSDFMKDIISSEFYDTEVLEALKSILLVNEKSSMINSRSFWYKKVDSLQAENLIPSLKRAINACYNLTLKSSITGNCNFDKDYFNQQFDKSYALVNNKKPDWQIARRLFEDNKLIIKTHDKFKTQLRIHYINITLQTICSIFITFTILKLIDNGFGWFQDNIIIFLNQELKVFNIFITDFIYLIILFFIIGGILFTLAEYFASKLFAIFKLPDFLESLQNLKHTIHDIRKLKKYNKK